jgi:hypothetical protein
MTPATSEKKAKGTRRTARRRARAFLDQQKEGRLSEVDARDLALEAQRWARRPKKRRA